MSAAKPKVLFHTFEKSVDVPSTSYYCQKLETFLRAGQQLAESRGEPGATYEVVHAFPYTSPKGKLPWIILRRPDEPDLSIADSHLIIRHLVDSNILPSPSSSLPAASLATERAWKSLTEEAYSCCVLLRWRDPKRWPRFYDIVFSSAPFLVRWALVPVFRRKVFYNLSSSLIWVHTDEEVLSFLLEYVSAVCGALEASAKSQPDRAKPFYFLGGEGPTQVDVETFAFWANAIVCDQSTPELMKALRESDALKRYVSGLTKRWFPEYTDRFRPYLEPYL